MSNGREIRNDARGERTPYGDGKRQPGNQIDPYVACDCNFDQGHEPHCAVVKAHNARAARQASQPSHASGEPTQQAHQLALDTIDRLQDERDTAFQRGVQAMAEKAAQLLLRIRNQMTDIVERERYNNIANQILDLPGAVEPPQDKLSALVAKWRKIIAECPVERQKRWRDVFEAVETCASELEAAAREPGASEEK